LPLLNVIVEGTPSRTSVAYGRALNNPAWLDGE
jgi:hypothetical protein